MSLLAVLRTRRVQSFLSRKIAPTRNISVFLWTVPGIPGTSWNKDKKKWVRSIEINVCAGHRQASKRIHLGTKWKPRNEGDSQAINTGQHRGQQRFCRVPFSSTPLAWHKGPVGHRQVHPLLPNCFPWILHTCLFFSLLRLLGTQPYLTLASLRGSS